MIDREPDRARVTTFVAVDPTDAFDVFTTEIDLWWRRGPAFRAGGPGGSLLRFEDSGGAGKRLVEIDPDAGSARLIGRVLAWEPGARLVFEWRGANFADDEVTEVEVLFEALGRGTRITLEHRGWAAIRGDHPVRHGQVGHGFTDMIGRWWGDLATALRRHIEAR